MNPQSDRKQNEFMSFNLMIFSVHRNYNFFIIKTSSSIMNFSVKWYRENLKSYLIRT